MPAPTKAFVLIPHLQSSTLASFPKLLVRVCFPIALALHASGCKPPPLADDGSAGGKGKEVEALSPSNSKQITAEPAPGKAAAVDKAFAAPGKFLEVNSKELDVSPEDNLAYYNETLFSGLAKSFYDNGQQASEVNYTKGKRDGLESSWYESGAKKFEARFRDNRLEGVFERWYEDGRKKSEQVWLDGKPVSVKEWNPGGELVRDD